jgi:hypothetical protein
VDFEEEADQKIFNIIFGSDGITKFDEIPEEPLSEKLFMFLIASGIKQGDLPDIDDSEKEWARTEQLMQWKFLQITRDEYISMYRELLSATFKGLQGEKPVLEDTTPQESTEDEPEPQIDMGDEENSGEAEGENTGAE